MTLSAPTGGATLGSNKVATVTVTDNDGQPGTVGFSATAYSIGESGGAVVLTVTRTGGSTGTAAVDYTTANGLAQAGSDFLASSGRLVWQNGDSAAKTITIPIYNDALREGAETILVRLSNVVTARLGTASATATIVDND
ncbi:MAG TPA: Calx-beta domain-containing protein [Nevskia sp.]|nr:Calx-beta domain-containing protein [Nevskia sp.]